MNQLEKIALKGKAMEMLEMKLNGVGEMTKIATGLVIEIDGRLVEFKAIVKADNFDLEDAVMELAEKVRKADEKAKAKAEKLAKIAKEKAEKSKE